MIAIELWDRGDTDRLSILTPDSPDPTYVYEDLEFSSNLWGFATCTFKMSRSPAVRWEDLEDSNIVRVMSGPDVLWEGDVENIGRDISDKVRINVECVGWSSRLKTLGTYADAGLDLGAGEKGSEYIADHILTDENLGFSPGDIRTDDFAITSGLEFFPGKSYEDILNEINQFNGWRPAVWEGKELDWKPRETGFTYIVHLEDCKDSTLNRQRSEIYNWCQWEYSDVPAYVDAEDTASQALHGKRCYWETISGDCTEAEAQQVADTFIAMHKDLKPSSNLTTDRIYDADRLEVPPETVRAGGVLLIESLLSTEETIATVHGVNEYTTWEIAECKYSDGYVTLSPGEPEETLDVMLAKIENRSRYL